ncbi:MAG: hypothetical protein PHC75_05565 [Burkholderiales bacterium]|nr:hypothetical protein [Burkholderiales bacterium]
MKKLIYILGVLNIVPAYAQAVNWYVWIINNSSDKSVSISERENRYWDNWGWDPCDTNWNNATTAAGQTSLKCGGTNNKSVIGYFGYSIVVKDKNGSVIFNKRQFLDTYNDQPANLSIKSGDCGNCTLKNMRINDNLDDKDGVVIYVFDDNGFSSTLLNYGSQHSYSNAGYPKELNLLEKKCNDSSNPNGCSLYQKYQ